MPHFHRSFCCQVARYLSWLIIAATSTSNLAAQHLKPIDFDQALVFDEVVEIVTEHFYRRDMDFDNWRLNVSREFREAAIEATDLDAFTHTMNRLLATLETSHTHYYSRLDPRRYQLLGIFHQLYDDRAELFVYDGVGLRTRQRRGLTVVSAVYEGFPAHRAGLQFGDVILAVDGQPFHPLLSFQDKKTVLISLRRADKTWQQEVDVESLDGRTMFEHAMRSSLRVIAADGSTVGYIHAWSYAGLSYQEILKEAVLWGELADSDALVLDLRDGWGGADINYLNLFRPPIAKVASTPRQGEARSFTGVWEKPVALLTDRYSTSGKELFAYGFQKLQLGKVFGEPTAGAVVAGRAFLLSNQDVLYLAVADVHVDGRRLEGQGVAPDTLVPRPWDAPGEDAPLEAAVDFLQTVTAHQN